MPVLTGAFVAEVSSPVMNMLPAHPKWCVPNIPNTVRLVSKESVFPVSCQNDELPAESEILD